MCVCVIVVNYIASRYLETNTHKCNRKVRVEEKQGDNPKFNVTSNYVRVTGQGNVTQDIRLSNTHTHTHTAIRIYYFRSQHGLAD